MYLNETETLERLLTMLAYSQGKMLNASRHASELALTTQAVTKKDL